MYFANHRENRTDVQKQTAVPIGPLSFEMIDLRAQLV